MTPHPIFRRLSRLAWICLAALAGCAASDHPTMPGDLGQPVLGTDLALQEPGPIRFERLVVADWEVDRSGLINLDHPRAREAGLDSGPEPIQIFLYVVDHPSFGTYLVDSGVESGFSEGQRNPRVGRIVDLAMNTGALRVHMTTADWLADRQHEGGALAGVFLTHIHLDHIMGLPDLPPDTPVYVGPGETRASAFLNLFTRGTLDAMLDGKGPLREWPFAPDPAGHWEGVVDIFGDGSAFALHVPGHSPGSTAFLLRTTTGPKLLVGDASHTRFGWEHGVEPGTFSDDGPRSVVSLEALRSFAERVPGLEVHLGHQRLGE